ncbi:MAG: carboxypeptidase regulatory-like domain-containing protein [Acidobacteriota bacterium]
MQATRKNLIAGIAVAFALLLLLPLTAEAQLQSGNLYGSAVDTKGAALPGVTLTLETGQAPQIQISDAQGKFRFLGLPPGAYKLVSTLEGFSSVEYPNIAITVGRNTTVEVTLQAAVEETITVSTESPLLDERKVSTGAFISKQELEKIPTARDPWSLLQQVPGVQTDRVNVGGNESGQQSLYAGPGSAGTNSIWAVDGVVITDMGALGGSPTYYDFGSFDEMQVTTGGSDATIATGGVVLNMVTKRGTNELRGSARYLDTSSSWQSNSGFDSADLGKAGPWQGPPSNQKPQPPFRGDPNKIGAIKDYGADLGGPIVKDRLWIWGSYGAQDIKNFVLGPLVGGKAVPDIHDNTKLGSFNAKINAQLTTANSLTGFYLRGEKTKIGRSAGPSRPQETTWDQSGPTNVYKVEDTQIFSSNFFATVMAAWGKNVFLLAPEGGLGTNANIDENFVWHTSYLQYGTERPQKQSKLDASSFFTTGSLSHELKYGAGYRTTDIKSSTRWPGFGIENNNYKAYGGYGLYPVLDAGGSVISLARQNSQANRISYKNAYLQDTLTAGNLTANLGLRYDVQHTENLAQTVPANAAFPSILPAVQYPGGGSFEWKTLAPRLGLTYALGAEHRTLLRASYSRFADQLGGTTASYLNPLGTSSYVYLYSNDLNHDGHIQPNEVLTGVPCAFCNAAGLGPSNSSYNNFAPGAFIQSGAVSPHFNAPTTDELLLSVEHALLPEFVVGLNLTYRKLNDQPFLDPLVFDGDPRSSQNLQSVGRRSTQADFTQHTKTVTLPNGKQRVINYYTLNENLGSRGGFYLFNSDITSTYKGAAVTFNKRLSNHWMMRGNFSYSDWVWNVPKGALADRTDTLPGGARDGEEVLQGSTIGAFAGSKGNVYLSSKWSYNVTGMYQVAPERVWGFNLAGSLTGRQGYAIPYWVRINRGVGGLGTQTVMATSADEFRNDDLRVLDLRIEKEFQLHDFNAVLGFDCFNALNAGTTLQRGTQLNLATTDRVTDVLSPRIFRIGLKLNLR